MLILAPLSQITGNVDSFGIDVRILTGAKAASFMELIPKCLGGETSMLTCAHIFSAAAICLSVGREERLPCLEFHGWTRYGLFCLRCLTRLVFWLKFGDTVEHAGFKRGSVKGLQVE